MSTHQTRVLHGAGIAVRSLWDVESLIKKKQTPTGLEIHPLEDFGNVYVVGVSTENEYDWPAPPLQ